MFPDKRSATLITSLEVGLSCPIFFSRFFLPESGIRSRSKASCGGLYFKTKYCWLSGVYFCFVRHLCLTAKTLVSDVQNTSVWRLKHLCLSRQRIVAVKTRWGRSVWRCFSLLPNSHKTVRSGGVRPTGHSPSSLAEATVCSEPASFKIVLARWCRQDWKRQPYALQPNK